MAEADRAGGGSGSFDRLDAERWSLLGRAIERLAGARSIDSVVDSLRESARRIVDADGITIVLRDDDKCHYVAEDSLAPLWQGSRFPIETCVSGWAMRFGQTVVIPDIRVDPRVPQDAYAQTFVRSMAMVPIGTPDAVAAIGAYWRHPGWPSESQIALLETLSRAAATAIENGRLLGSLETLNADLEQRVTERTDALEKAQEALRRTQKLEVIGQLTGNVAHDFNNLMSPIMASLDLVLAQPGNGDAVTRSTNAAMEAVERAKALVERLLSVARQQPLKPSAVTLDALVRDMADLIGSTVGPDVSLSIDMADALPPVMVDRHQLELAILNLAVNAREAMAQGGRLRIAATPVQGAPGGLGGDFVRLTIDDDGVGMTPETARRATEPFFTTKPNGQGVGLGLSVVDGFVSQAGGAMEMTSARGQGTRIDLWLPAHGAAAAATVPATPPAPATSSGDDTVLLIDDETIVRMGTAAMLGELGYSVVEADTAGEALDMIASGLRPDIVVTDHLMPGMTGAELAQRLKAEWPTTAVLIISGFQGVDTIAPDVVRVAKPFRQTHLAAGIAAARERAYA